MLAAAQKNCSKLIDSSDSILQKWMPGKSQIIIENKTGHTRVGAISF